MEQCEVCLREVEWTIETGDVARCEECHHEWEVDWHLENDDWLEREVDDADSE